MSALPSPGWDDRTQSVRGEGEPAQNKAENARSDAGAVAIYGTVSPSPLPLSHPGEGRRSFMDPSFLLLQSLNGLASASSLFITPCGLTIVFGVTRIVNFAHGSLYMLGRLHRRDPGPAAARIVPSAPASFWAGILVSAVVVGLIGVADGGAAAAPHLPRAGAVPAARHLRRGAGRAGPRHPSLRAAGYPGAARAGLARAGRDPRPALPSYELVPDRRRAAGARPPLAAAARRASACWCARRRRTGRWSARSASIRRCCSPARFFSARSSPGSAARCRSRKAPPTRAWTSPSLPRASSSRWSAAWASSRARSWPRSSSGSCRPSASWCFRRSRSCSCSC